jgi:hypothetical protein
VSTIDVQEAFRRGVRGEPLVRDDKGPRALAEEAAPFAGGPSEAVLLGVRRLPGLSDPGAAYETGRALRMVVRLFDRAGAGEHVGRQFIDNLAAAVMTHHMRHLARPWDAADTVDMFAEMYGRILGGGEKELAPIRRALMDYAVGEDRRAAPARSGGLAALFRRRRTARVA